MEICTLLKQFITSPFPCCRLLVNNIKCFKKIIKDSDNIFLNTFCYFAQYVYFSHNLRKISFFTWEWNFEAACVSCNSRWVGGPLILSFPLYFAHNFISFDSFNFHPWFIVYFLWIKLSNYYMLRLAGKKSAQKLNCSHFSISYGNTMSTWWFKLKTFEAFWIYCFCPPSYEFRKFP